MTAALLWLHRGLAEAETTWPTRITYLLSGSFQRMFADRWCKQGLLGHCKDIEFDSWWNEKQLEDLSRRITGPDLHSEMIIMSSVLTNFKGQCWEPEKQLGLHTKGALKCQPQDSTADSVVVHQHIVNSWRIHSNTWHLLETVWTFASRVFIVLT
jgi:hypothetical protein